MSNYLNEHDLENLFQTHLPPIEIPPEFAAHLEERVLTKVARSIKKTDGRIAFTESPEPVEDADSTPAQKISPDGASGEI